MSAIELDESRHPLVLVKYPPDLTVDDVREVFRRYQAISERGAKVGYLIDFLEFNPVTAPADQRRTAAEIFSEYKHVLAKVTVCEARVVKNRLSRGILTAFDWLTPSSWPRANFANRDEAEAWMNEQFRLHGLPVSPAAKIAS
jgi:hypothetical protein